MRMQIAILEARPDRQAVMRDCLQDRFYQYGIRFFDAPAELIEFASENSERLIAMALDLDESTSDDGGSGAELGQDVVEFLRGQSPVYGLVVHSTNEPAAAKAATALREAGWTVECVAPGDASWIAESWFPAVRRAIVHGPRVQPGAAARHST